MSIIGEAILTASIEMLLEKLTSDVIKLFARREQIEADLKKWEKLLVKIKAALDDADEKQTTNRSVKIWLAELQTLAYDVEDILDQFATEVLQRKLADHQHQPSTSNLRKLIPTCCSKLSSRSLKFESMMASEIEEITARFKEIAEQKDLLDLKESSAGRPNRVNKRSETTSLVCEAEVLGRDDEKKALIDLLLKDDLSANDGFSVIPITGMGGLGKTTLAQLVYNDRIVESHFGLKAWACVSEDFDAIRITKAILKSTGVQTAADDDLNSLQVNLKSVLSGKKFLLILDDMWNENYGDWTTLRLPFTAGVPGSKIIVTTRNQNVATMMGTVPSYELTKLSDNDCLFVFTQHSLGARDFNEHQQLKKFGIEIVKKCNGLPLAARTLGGLLHGKFNLCDWKKVLNNKIWNFAEEGDDIMRALKVSYYYLPAYLKRCFAYCSLLPKDYEFHERDIVLLWMAEGLLQPDTSGKDMEQSGHDYFQELRSRSFLQQSSTDTSLFVMHDLINDLALWAAREYFFRLEDTLEGNKQQKFSKRLRHLSYVTGYWDGIKRFDTLSDVEHLRTFLSIALSNSQHYLSYGVIHLLLKLQSLRVLSLRGYRIFKIPNSIGDLKYLRHLDLSETDIQTLPESANTLINLHTLLLEKCRRLKKLCVNIGNLINMRHLNNSDVPSLEEMPLGIGKLSLLQTLCHFVVGENIGSQLQELKFLKKLRGKLKISRLESVKDVGHAKEAELNDKRNLDELIFEWSSNIDNSREPGKEMHVLEMLRPHENLKKLTINRYGGTEFPVWIKDSTFRNLVLLKFENCGMCKSLPSVGQLPVLEHLFIIGMSEVKSVGSEFYGNSNSVPFPSLKILSFEDMQEWRDWIPHGSSEKFEAFPQLQELSLVKCFKLLGRLPEYLPLLERLVIRACEELVVSISSPTLRKLEISGCKKLVWRSTVDLCLPNSLDSSDMPNNQVFLTGILAQQFTNLEELAIGNIKEGTYLWRTGCELLQDVSFLHQLKTASCPQHFSLVAEEEEDQLQHQGLPCRLRYQNSRDCHSLVKLPLALFSFHSLKQIEISQCDSLESLPDGWMHNSGTPLESLRIVSCNSLTCIARVQLPPSLKRIEIWDCKNLRTLIDEDQVSQIEGEDRNSGCSSSYSSLEDLHIRNCPSLTSLLSKSELPDTLEDISITGCSKLAFLSLSGNLPEALKVLSVDSCSEIESIAKGLDHNTSLEQIYVIRCSKLAFLSLSGNLPKALKVLSVDSCSELESIAKGLDHSTSLERITIYYCQNLKVLPDNLHKARHLQDLYIWGCPKLVSLPQGGLPTAELRTLCIIECENLKALSNCMHNLTSLQLLQITSCPSIGSIPDNGLPTNLHTLRIDNQKMYKPLFEEGLHRFTSITSLSLDGECSDVVSFGLEDTGMALPASLTSLQIDSFPILESLSSIENLTSLEHLEIYSCPKLEYFPEKGLPTSLLSLRICGCPLIKEKCKRDEGEYWPLITHIPEVRIDGLWALIA